MLGKLLTFMVARVTGQEEIMADNRILDMTGPRTTSRLPPSNKAARGGSAPAKKAAGAGAKKAAKKAATEIAKKAANKVAKKTAPKAAK